MLGLARVYCGWTRCLSPPTPSKSIPTVCTGGSVVQRHGPCCSPYLARYLGKAWCHLHIGTDCPARYFSEQTYPIRLIPSPQQPSCYDCGVYMLNSAEAFLYGGARARQQGNCTLRRDITSVLEWTEQDFLSDTGSLLVSREHIFR